MQDFAEEFHVQPSPDGEEDLITLTVDVNPKLKTGP
jgi:hypothetical protein